MRTKVRGVSERLRSYGVYLSQEELGRALDSAGLSTESAAAAAAAGRQIGGKDGLDLLQAVVAPLRTSLVDSLGLEVSDACLVTAVFGRPDMPAVARDAAQGRVAARDGNVSVDDFADAMYELFDEHGGDKPGGDRSGAGKARFQDAARRLFDEHGGDKPGGDRSGAGKARFQDAARRVIANRHKPQASLANTSVDDFADAMYELFDEHGGDKPGAGKARFQDAARRVIANRHKPQASTATSRSTTLPMPSSLANTSVDDFADAMYALFDEHGGDRSGAGKARFQDAARRVIANRHKPQDTSVDDFSQAPPSIARSPTLSPSSSSSSLSHISSGEVTHSHVPRLSRPLQRLVAFLVDALHLDDEPAFSPLIRPVSELRDLADFATAPASFSLAAVAVLGVDLGRALPRNLSKPALVVDALFAYRSKSEESDKELPASADPDFASASRISLSPQQPASPDMSVLSDANLSLARELIVAQHEYAATVSLRQAEAERAYRLRREQNDLNYRIAQFRAATASLASSPQPGLPLSLSPIAPPVSIASASPAPFYVAPSTSPPASPASGPAPPPAARSSPPADTSADTRVPCSPSPQKVSTAAIRPSPPPSDSELRMATYLGDRELRMQRNLALMTGSGSPSLSLNSTTPGSFLPHLARR
ncbi:uncharacterized protein AMSG_10371 [Thecamonas trahens ATCC 50062]|uniref:Uncharacterized protein n=1 Tax=Thecamonas trahens ATCC 50062 TaxID=461836 RepID=A0A0L0DQH9_THETB|nr:hypothetical protein AMSG_10371 [Thecamonas trahens ATCC 50062]KNC54525.1 hypothetical protein AMSG_10371 [Thecamonas trahens ATCC 50062]|eukprot:XP_013753542.1 hypothetical protein AMSG_10371 [Thecamonas trahens ATCC 50062]